MLMELTWIRKKCNLDQAPWSERVIERSHPEAPCGSRIRLTRLRRPKGGIAVRRAEIDVIL